MKVVLRIRHLACAIVKDHHLTSETELGTRSTQPVFRCHVCNREGMISRKQPQLLSTLGWLDYSGWEEHKLFEILGNEMGRWGLVRGNIRGKTMIGKWYKRHLPPVFLNDVVAGDACMFCAKALLYAWFHTRSLERLVTPMIHCPTWESATTALQRVTRFSQPLAIPSTNLL